MDEEILTKETENHFLNTSAVKNKNIFIPRTKKYLCMLAILTAELNLKH